MTRACRPLIANFGPRLPKGACAPRATPSRIRRSGRAWDMTLCNLSRETPPGQSRAERESGEEKQKAEKLKPPATQARRSHVSRLPALAREAAARRASRSVESWEAEDR